MTEQWVKFLVVRGGMSVFVLSLIFTQNPVASLVGGVLAGSYYLIASSLLRKPLKRVIADQIEKRKAIINKRKPRYIASKSDHILSVFYWGLNILLFLIIPCFLYLFDWFSSFVQKISEHRAFWVLAIVLLFLYYSVVLLNYRKKYFWLHSVLWISVFVTGVLGYFDNSLNLEQSDRTALQDYAKVVGLLCGGVTVFDYFDKKVQEKGGATKRNWDNFFSFISWDFLDQRYKQ